MYPYRPQQEIVAGQGALRIASDRDGPVTVTVLMPEDDGAATLPLNLYVVSDTLAEPDTEAFAAELTRIFAQAVTTPGADNLMEDGTGLTADQAFALTRSALLQ